MSGDPGLDAARLHDAVQAAAPALGGGRCVLTGWVLVAEWMDERGKRWLSQTRAPGTTPWGAGGMLHHGLYGAREARG